MFHNIRSKLRNRLDKFKVWLHQNPSSIEQLLLHKKIVIVNQQVEECKIKGKRVGEPLLRKVCRKGGNSPHINFPATPDVLSLMSRKNGEGEFVEVKILQTGEQEATAIITKPKEVNIK